MSAEDPGMGKKKELSRRLASQTDRHQEKVGVVYALSAFIWWGGCVFYFKAVAHVSPLEVLAHRIIWTAMLLVGLLAVRGRLRASAESMKDIKKIVAIFTTTILISINWFVFIWAIANDQVLQTSLGYFINPLFNVLLGFVFLRERFRTPQVVAIILATIGVAFLWIDQGRVPAVALALAFTFGVYGLIRKTTNVEGVVGLAVETVCIAPMALVYLTYLAQTETLAFAHTNRVTDVLLLSAGIVTALPMVWFVNAAQRLRYATVGLMQYIAPTLTFLFAVFIFHEPFGKPELLSFALIWSGLALYGWTSFSPSGKAADSAAKTPLTP
jgi:chloramphenicol-sensitive protein RarD